MEQIGEYKNRVHREFLEAWAAGKEDMERFSTDDVWRIREECIAALGAGVYRPNASTHGN